MQNPPKHFTGRAKQLWKAYVEELESRDMLLEADLPALERLCLLEAEAEKLTLEIAKRGAISKDRDKTERRNPALLALVNISGLVTDLKKSLAIGAYYRHRMGKELEKEKPKPTRLYDLMRPTNRPTEN